MTVLSKGHEMDWQQPTDAENSECGTKTPLLQLDLQNAQQFISL